MRTPIYRFLFIGMLLTACGGLPDRVVEAEYAPLLEQYLALAPNDGVYEEVIFVGDGDPTFGAEGEEHIHGTCFQEYRREMGMRVGVQRSVIMKPAEAKGFAWQRIFFHELGHCIHDLKHSDDPNDIMYHTVDPENEERWEGLLVPSLIKMLEGTAQRVPPLR